MKKFTSCVLTAALVLGAVPGIVNTKALEIPVPEFDSDSAVTTDTTAWDNPWQDTRAEARRILNHVVGNNIDNEQIKCDTVNDALNIMLPLVAYPNANTTPRPDVVRIHAEINTFNNTIKFFAEETPGDNGISFELRVTGAKLYAPFFPEDEYYLPWGDTYMTESAFNHTTGHLASLFTSNTGSRKDHLVLIMEYYGNPGDIVIKGLNKTVFTGIMITDSCPHIWCVCCKHCGRNHEIPCKCASPNIVKIGWKEVCSCATFFELWGTAWDGNLEVFEQFSNLTCLYLSGGWISDLSPLARMSQLENVWICFRDSALSLAELREMFSDISAEFMPSTPMCDFSDCNACVIMLPTTIPVNTVSLSFYNQNIDNAQLAEMIADGTIPQDVTELSLYNNQISDLTPLAGLTNLWLLYLDDNQISDLTPLAGLTNLRALYLNNNQISDLTPLSGLINLRLLYLDNNQISDLTPLSGMTNLVDLTLDNNQISDISPLAGLTDLLSLSLNDTQISDLTPLVGLTNLRYLTLSSNKISDISLLAGFTNLLQLYLSNNPINVERIHALQKALPDTEIYANQQRPIGDVNGDGVVTITDALEILMYLAGLSSELDNFVNYARALQISGGEKVTISDALEILMYLAGLDSRIERR
jgi:Leucine-rich repeat (LRR) protein